MGNRVCMQQHQQTQDLDHLFPGQADFELDWSNEKSIMHRTAINCLHNYALGKMEASIVNHTNSARKKRSKNKGSLKFDEKIERIFVYSCYDIGLVPIHNVEKSSETSQAQSQDLF
jgi:hypothetical protein